jgi:hypothetical protein
MNSKDMTYDNNKSLEWHEKSSKWKNCVIIAKHINIDNIPKDLILSQKFWVKMIQNFDRMSSMGTWNCLEKTKHGHF